jgi:cyclopropane-fatty-acyl-phospholipid synthase
MIDRIARAIALRALRHTRGGVLEICEHGRCVEVGALDPAAPLRARVDVRSPRAWRALLFGGGRGLGGAYAEGQWDGDDLVTLIRIAARNAARFDALRHRLRLVLVPWRFVTGPVRANTAKRSRKQIAHHYDLGNELFALMLDDTMMYSAAIYPQPGASLHEAQIHKLDEICAKLQLGPDDHLLEIGSGWGALAIHAARNCGCRVTTTTISREQFELASARVRAAGLAGRVTVLLEDYRSLSGRYDKLVSVEMVEAVGWRNFKTFFETCSRLLKPDGLMLLQAITTDDRAFEAEKATRSFIRTYIFPGGCLPSMEIIARSVARHTDLRAVGLDDITAHYVPTLAAWRSNVARHASQLHAMGYDDRFRRLWDLYLAYCEGGFAERRIQDVQLLLAKPRFRDEPLAAQSRGLRVNIRALSASSSNPGPRDASRASSSLLPGRSTAASDSIARTVRRAHSSGDTDGQPDVSM